MTSFGRNIYIDLKPKRFDVFNLIIIVVIFVYTAPTKPAAKTLLDPKRAQNLGKLTCSRRTE